MLLIKSHISPISAVQPHNYNACLSYDVMDVAWILLIIAGVMETGWIYALEKSDDFKNKKWDVICIVIMAIDIYLLSVAMQSLGAGISYAVWTGIGAVTTFILGVTVFKESMSWLRVLFIFMIIGGIVGLNLVSGGVING